MKVELLGNTWYATFGDN